MTQGIQLLCEQIANSNSMQKQENSLFVVEYK